MSKTETKFYICTHDACPFKTGKRKAIYTHLVRTHAERKEDYECEYCCTVFQDEQLVENHLVTCHPEEQFTYTCVSRIENVINQCAKLGSSQTDPAGSDDKKTNKNTQPNSPANTIDSHETQTLKLDNYSRTKASVNKSLNTLAAKNHKVQSAFDPHTLLPSDSELDIRETNDSATLMDNTGGLKMKLNLKMITYCSAEHSTKERSASPPKLEPASFESEIDSELEAASPPNIISSRGLDGVSIREKSSKYFDRLEVYHTTDEHGRRCCPFCPYKTTKNTIRVHLSGIHKIYFVKCSLCEYKAAFPHQVTQHGVKFHKTTNLNVIQLSKESRERTISKLNSAKNGNHVTDSNQSYNYSLNSCSTENSVDTDIFEEDNFSDESSVISGDDEPDVLNTGTPPTERSYKPPKSQMSKTDYFSIQLVNGVHLYSCNLCPFRTPVRATIYTHKYRHEDKSYRCAYCDFTSAPRSNVVHHIRSKHKDRAIIVTVVNDEDDVNTELSQEFDERVLKQEPSSPDYIYDTADFQTIMDNKDPPTIIKVPQFKRTLMSTSGENDTTEEMPPKRQKTGLEVYKLSLNKLYKVNPTGSPKYVCVECNYGCDTHPKMKHHLYRHRPQQYKCPYCDHRKYPRSYVVRHVRDTHRDKPVRVIDLSIGPDPIDIPEYMDDQDDDRGVPHDINESMDIDNSDSVHVKTDDSFDDVNDAESPDGTQDTNTCETKNGERVQIKVEPDDSFTDEQHSVDDSLSDSLNSTTSILNNLIKTPNLTSGLLDDSNDVSPNFSEVVYTSTPLIESLINGKFPGSSPLPDKPVQKTSVFKKKSTKEYRINYGDGPKYICNVCGYGTENYKTIHNHMYRHESQKYQCPYCGYRRSPKSFVENHIREVHRGHPLFVTELNDDLERRVPLGSPRQCVMMKQQLEKPTLPVNRATMDDLNLPIPSKLQVKWPAPKAPSQINLSVPSVKNTPTLHIPVRQKPPNAVVVPGSIPRLAGTGNHSTSAMDPAVLPPNVAPFKPTDRTNVLPRCSVPKLTDGGGRHVTPKPSLSSTPPFKFKEPSRTTFKTMYKCVFDPESCNHISKDKSKMKQHLFMHVEYKPWTCDLCDMTASQSSHIKNHVRTEHYGVSDMSFKYRKHNYLEKHIESFLTKGLFTVPVSEYRMIMDMKGTTKVRNKASFTRDSDGFVLCPHCDYKTKSGSMTDHVKMKHMQPRFKCLWCTFKAFYRAEIRRHHRKEKSHSNLEFKIQQLDVVEEATEFIEGKTTDNVKQLHAARFEDSGYRDGDDGDLEDDDDASSNEDLSDYIEYSTGKVNTLLFNKTKQAVVNTPVSLGNDIGDVRTPSNNHSSENVGSNKDNNGSKRPAANNDTSQIPTRSKFRCGYCPFTAALRVKVKMHCTKKHPDQALQVLEPNLPETVTKDNIMRVNCSELRGTKFEEDLKKAGVSKLNLASLFSRNTNGLCMAGNTGLDDDAAESDDEKGNNSDDDEKGGNSDDDIHDERKIQLTIPFKQATEHSNIGIMVSNMSNEQENKSDTAFKKPMDPAPLNKLTDFKEPTAMPEKNSEKRESVKSLELNELKVVEDIVVVQPLETEPVVVKQVNGGDIKIREGNDTHDLNNETSIIAIEQDTAIETETLRVNKPVATDGENDPTTEYVDVNPDYKGDTGTGSKEEGGDMTLSDMNPETIENEVVDSRDVGDKITISDTTLASIESTDIVSKEVGDEMTISDTNPESIESTDTSSKEEGGQMTNSDTNLESVERTEIGSKEVGDEMIISIPALDVDIGHIHTCSDKDVNIRQKSETPDRDNNSDDNIDTLNGATDNCIEDTTSTDSGETTMDTLDNSVEHFSSGVVYTTYPCGNTVVLEADN